MKTLKITLIALCLGLVVSEASASKPSKGAYKRSMEYAINSYIDGVCYGKAENYINLLAEETTFSMLRGNRIYNYTRNQEINSLKGAGPAVQNCEPSFKITQKDDKTATVKVTMKYLDFSRFNYVTLKNEASGWKVTHVSSVIK